MSATATVRPGPERATFYEEQASRRRHARWWSLFIGPTALLTGLPLAAVLSPLVFGAGVGVLRLVGVVLPLPETLWDFLRYLAGALPAAFDGALDDSALPGRWSDLAAAVLTLLGPGLVASFLLWRAVTAWVVRVGAGAELARLEAREPRPDDPEERQLVNVVEEIAIAAGVAPPAVRLIEDPEPRAALLGSSPQDAAVVLSRGVLDRCDRAATQGVVAHLVASQVNGDLRFGRTVLSVFQTLGLTFTLLDALVGWSPSAWRDLRTFARGTWHWKGGRAGGGEPARRLAELLGGNPAAFRRDGLHGAFLDAAEQEPKTRLGRTVGRFPHLWALLVPFLLPVVLVLFLRMEVLLLRSMVISPLVVPVLRARRYLADATAVELTRDPDAVAAGLAALAPAPKAEPPPGGPWLEHRFVVGRGGTTPAGPSTDQERPLTGTASPHPPLGKRLARLVRQGAGAGWLEAAEEGAPAKRARPRFRDLPVWRQAFAVVSTIVLLPILALCAYLTLIVVAAVVGLGAAGSVFFAAVAMHLIERVLIPPP